MENHLTCKMRVLIFTLQENINAWYIAYIHIQGPGKKAYI